MATNKKSARSSRKSKGDTSDMAAQGANVILGTNDVVAEQAAASDDLVAEMPHNSIKELEYGYDNAVTPAAGVTVEPDSAALTASTSTEETRTAKTGGAARLGTNATVASLDRVRVDAGDQPLTTNQGVRIGDNQNTLKAGLRGPSLLEDFILREKITHFDHERIPERIVHARGSGAHGFFEAYDALTQYTRAAPFAKKGKITPVFVRFSTVAGERGSKDTARDARGFAVKFYTDEGNWDLVGNNIPVFFIQDAMKFPDLVHALKPEPHHGMPQAGSAHDTFWDFVSLMPESTHMLMWAMSDRAIPRSYRMMQGFGVHTFRLVNDQGQSVFCKFHWTPRQGTHSLVWDEAVKIAGADADFHRRDLWEAIESGEFPEWELGLQIFTEEQAEGFSFDVLDSTKIVPEALVPLLPVGRMVLNRNPDNFFAETEQVAFCAAHIIPGIDFSNDPLLAGRIHSYADTQITRLGGPNFHEIPINTPLAPVQNNQRDGMHRQALHRGRVAYEPNSLAGGCPFQAGTAGFMSFPEVITEDKVRGKPEKFAEHYAQATLFYESQTAVEKAHIAAAFRFELSKVGVLAIRERMLSSLVNVSPALAAQVAGGLGMAVPDAMPKAIADPKVPEVTVSPALSLMALPGECGIRTRQIAVLVEDGAHHASLVSLYGALADAGAVVHFVGPRVGLFVGDSGEHIEANKSMENSPAVLFDALVLPDGIDAVQALAGNGHTMEFIKNTFRHCKTILALGAGRDLLELAGVGPVMDDDEGILLADGADAAGVASAFIDAMASHRHFSRESDPYAQ
ncbi:catalase [Ectothiorhodospira lacustris]|uniref:catalase n=1 Tax=Ectothiorhodospira lacustris TaxID=2899127 RepID=UPI001EE82C60|nr:catalase [Ectothiorhodospira lacustris]MCG5499903.1 catalase [Ectothiorhodospira lacustris]MCG5508822.1 catalase [Ectothiorhodospira lacustris]MCG5520613.1 catalase [Ectothiorhodospira lacustris]